MSEHYFSSTKKHTYSQEPTYLPTAEKSQYKYQPEGYFDRTPEKIQYSAKKGSIISEARRSIDQCIHMVSEKKKMNEEAFGQVKNINNQILGSLSWLNPVKTNLYEPRNKTTDQYRRDDFRENIAVSQFEWKPFTSPQRSYEEEVRQFPTFHDTNANQENVDLRSKLNNQIKRNNDLLKHINNLEAEVATLRSSNYKGVQSPNLQEVLQQNRYLKNQLANSYAGNNYNLIEELERLKAENSELRRDTITLLKSRPY